MPRHRSALRLVDVAERAGVSLATASRALAGRDGVSEQVANHVRQVARELGYVANLHARTLAGGSTSTVGLIVHQIDDPYFSEIASGVLQVAGEQDLMVQICHSGRDPQRRAASRSGTSSPSASASSSSPAPATSTRGSRPRRRPSWRRSRSTAGGWRSIGRHASASTPCCPTTRPAGARSASTCSALGHRRIAVAAGTERLTTVADRLAGVAAALRGRRAVARRPAGRARPTSPATAAARRPSRSCATTPTPPRSSPSTTRWRSACCRRCARTASPCPSRCRWCGFDDVSVAADLAPSLTTIRLPMTDMGQLALSMALKPRSARPRRKTTGHSLVVRDSTGPAPS